MDLLLCGFHLRISQQELPEARIVRSICGRMAGQETLSGEMHVHKMTAGEQMDNDTPLRGPSGAIGSSSSSIQVPK